MENVQSSYHNHYLRSKTPKSTSPIEIPLQKRSSPSSIYTPTTRSLSSDLLFDMSPDPPSHHLHIESPTTKAVEVGTFMYRFPTLAIPATNIRSLNNKNNNPERALDHRPLSSIPSPQFPALSSRTGTNKTAAPARSSPAMVARTKICGFEPLNPPAGSSSGRVRKPSGHQRCAQRISPPPRSSSYSSSPWILIGEGGLDDEDVSNEDVHLRALEFETYLVRRIDDPAFRTYRRPNRQDLKH